MFNPAALSFIRQRHVRACSLLLLMVSALDRISLRGAGVDRPLPAPEEVTRNLIAHSQGLATTNGGPQYVYPKRTLIERLDSAGKATSTEERLYEVTLIGGIPLNRLLKITGRDLTPDEIKTEQEREEKFQQRLSSMDPKKMVARREGLVNAELLDHYRYTVTKRIQLNGRSTLVVDFKPKDNPSANDGLRDRVLNRIAGTLWVDEEDWELAKVSARLTDTISMGWFGLLGSLSQCELLLDRERLADGIWVNTKQAWSIQFRKLTSTTRIRVAETSSGFRRIEKK